MPLDARSSGRKACVTARVDHTLTSKSFLASGMERSEKGMLYEVPALLTRMLRLGSLATQAAIEDEDRMSNVSVSMPRAVTCVILEAFRAVA